MSKKFAETKVGQFLSKAAPGILDTVGDIFPPAKVLLALFDQEPNIPTEQRVEYEHLVKEYELNELKAYLDDVQNARAMQIASLGQDDKFSKRFVYYLAGVSVLLGFLYIYLITFASIPVVNQRFADTILGVVITVIFGTIYGYFFGSSKGSSEKNKIFENLKSKP